MDRDVIYTVDETSPMSQPSLWLSSDYGVTLDVNNKVTSWISKIGSFTASQTVEVNRPSFVQNAVGTKPVIRFNGVNNFLNTTNYQFVQNCTMFTVVRHNTTDTVMTLTPSLGVNNSLYGYSVLYYTQTGTMRLLSTSISTTVFGNSSSFSQHLTNYNVLSSTVSGLNTQNYLNNIALPPQIVAGSTLAIANTIGKRDTQYSNGDLAELIIYHSVLTDNQRKIVYEYLRKKYNL